MSQRNCIIIPQHGLLFAFHILPGVVGDKLNPGEIPSDRLFQLFSAIEIELARPRVPKLVDLLWVDVARVHHRQELQWLTIHDRHKRRVNTQEIEIGGQLFDRPRGFDSRLTLFLKRIVLDDVGRFR